MWCSECRICVLSNADFEFIYCQLTEHIAHIHSDLIDAPATIIHISLFVVFQLTHTQVEVTDQFDAIIP